MNSALNTLLFFGWIISLIVFFGNKASGPPAGDGGSYRNNFPFGTGSQNFGAMFPAPSVPWHAEQNFRTTF